MTSTVVTERESRGKGARFSHGFAVLFPLFIALTWDNVAERHRDLGHAL